jgi:hypothetical protein
VKKQKSNQRASTGFMIRSGRPKTSKSYSEINSMKYLGGIEERILQRVDPT